MRPRSRKRSGNEVRLRHRRSKALFLYRLAFDDVVSDLLKVKPADPSERAGQKAHTWPSKVRKGSRRKG
jgi:hypothetical protein